MKAAVAAPSVLVTLSNSMFIKVLFVFWIIGFERTTDYYTWSMDICCDHTMNSWKLPWLPQQDNSRSHDGITATEVNTKKMCKAAALLHRLPGTFTKPTAKRSRIHHT